MIFSHIIGNEKNKQLLKNVIKTNQISHSYIFEGIDGIGKKKFAKEFAKAILCYEQEKKPCLICKSCIEFDNNNNPDITFIESEGASIKIEQIREMKKTVLEKPINSTRKIYVINHSEKMTKEAQNSLLKVLEEPPEYICIILITTNINLFLNTIKSRCIKIHFEGLKDNQIKKILTQESLCCEIPDSILRFSEGSLKKAIQLNSKKDIYIGIDEVFSNLENISIIELLNTKDKLLKDKDEIYCILDYINLIFFNKIKENFEESKYIKCMNIAKETKDRLNKNNNYDMTIDRFIIKIWEEVNG